VKTDFKTHRLWTDGSPTSTEYFLVENRQQTASDTFLPGSGLLVWHIDDSVFSNADENHPRVKLIQADGLDELKANLGRGDAGDPFPGYSHNTAFTDTSTPSSKSYAGDATHVSITAIPLPAETMSFSISVRAPAPQTLDARTWYRRRTRTSPRRTAWTS
jgi:immune inhibitor A